MHIYSYFTNISVMMILMYVYQTHLVIRGITMLSISNIDGKLSLENFSQFCQDPLKLKPLTNCCNVQATETELRLKYRALVQWTSLNLVCSSESHQFPSSNILFSKYIFIDCYITNKFEFKCQLQVVNLICGIYIYVHIYEQVKFSMYFLSFWKIGIEWCNDIKPTYCKLFQMYTLSQESHLSLMSSYPLILCIRQQE